ncbi:hypothetical protein MU1CBH_12640 [Megamonas funiformis]|nr:hypothetical protein MU1CBH_12640 [Megamonas funiformis]
MMNFNIDFYFRFLMIEKNDFNFYLKILILLRKNKILNTNVYYKKKKYRVFIILRISLTI